MAEDHSDFRISAFECDVLRNAFKKSVIDESIPEYRWRSHAMLLVRELTDHEHVDSEALDWLVRK
ncbi:hypothetical protein [Mesorhizobium temperatum]|uniref:Uncharacterized protein n=1 Tax=Mesorhizobium temperatum TaxID=241416 RepID=A0A271LKS7_9HYPH|nr:hypothetical protein [Mesorhizobium temperatum]PAQ08437.1 hypothetical protein CIT26_15930 [Mesorhizobium temperatum]